LKATLHHPKTLQEQVKGEVIKEIENPSVHAFNKIEAAVNIIKPFDRKIERDN